jgi:hypothetical protein
MTAADRVIRWTTAVAVIGVAAVVSYEHAGDLVRAHGETGWTARLIPLTVDGLIYVSSMVMLDSARRDVRVPALARWRAGSSAWALLRRSPRTSPTAKVMASSAPSWPRGRLSRWSDRMNS